MTGSPAAGDDWPLAIAQVTPYPWGARREVNEYVEHVADGLAQRGHRVLVLAASVGPMPATGKLATARRQERALPVPTFRV